MGKFIGFLVLLAFAVGLLYFVPVGKVSESKLYTSDVYGVSFSYPAKYFVIEADAVDGERAQYSIVLMEDTPENRALISDPQSATEGPPTITIMLFQNNLDNYTTKRFIQDTNFSNFKLSDGVLATTTVDGEEGMRYSATGLYENTNVVIARPDLVYMFTAFYNAPNDAILADFEDILASVSFSKTGSDRTPTSADNAPPGSIHNLPVPPAVAAVRAHVATKAGIDEGFVIIMTAYEREWPDACLGLAGSDEMCAQVITPGWEVTTQAGGAEEVFRTNSGGSVIRQER